MVLFTCDNIKKRSLKQWHVNIDSHNDNETDSEEFPEEITSKVKPEAVDQVKWDPHADRGASVYIFIMTSSDHCPKNEGKGNVIKCPVLEFHLFLETFQLCLFCNSVSLFNY